MKIGIFGVGAIGSALAAEIYNITPNEIYLCANLNYINKINKGINVNSIHYDIAYTSNEKMDYLFICLKNYDLENSLKDISLFVSSKTIIIPILNGVSATETLKKHFKDNRVCYGMIRIEANKTNSGVNTSKITELAFGLDEHDDDLDKLHKLLKQGGINDVIYEDMKRAVWRKFMLNVGINQVSALTNSTYDDMRHPYLSDLIYHLMTEVVKVAEAMKINISDDDAKFMIDDLSKRDSKRVTSLTEDIINKRKSEVDYFGLVVINYAKKYHIDTPYNDIVYKMLRAICDNYEKTK